MGKSLREKAKEQLQQRSKEAFDSKDSSGMYDNFFRKDLENVKMWKCENGEHAINILISEAGVNYPTQPPYQHIKEGDVVYFLDIWVHRNIGVNETTVVCPARNYGKDCPICEQVAELRKLGLEEDKETIKLLNPKRRTVYNMVCLDSSEEEAKGVQVWEVAHFFMQKHLAARSKKRKGGGYIHFADPEEGREVIFERAKNGDNVEFTNHDFAEREGYTIDDDTLDSAHCIDDMITIYDYDTLKTMFLGKKEEVVEDINVVDDPSDAKAEEVKDVEEESTPRRGRVQEKAKSDNKCPKDHTFGRDADKTDDCNDCDEAIWTKCHAEQKNYEKANPVKTGRTRRSN